MTALTSCQLFAERGDVWNTPNYQHPSRGRVRVRRDPDGFEHSEIVVDIDGYPQTTKWDRPKRAEPKRMPYEPRGESDPTTRQRANRAMHVKRLFATAVPASQAKPRGEARQLRRENFTTRGAPSLTPEQQAQRQAQREVEEARMRAAAIERMIDQLAGRDAPEEIRDQFRRAIHV